MTFQDDLGWLGYLEFPNLMLVFLTLLNNPGDPVGVPEICLGISFDAFLGEVVIVMPFGRIGKSGVATIETLFGEMGVATTDKLGYFLWSNLEILFLTFSRDDADILKGVNFRG